MHRQEEKKMSVHELAGKPAPRSILANIPRLVSAYYTHTPDASDPAQRVAFGTSGHRGSSLETASTKGTSWPSARPSANTGNQKRSTARCSWAWIPTPSPKRRWPPPSRSSPPTGSHVMIQKGSPVHAHAGHLPCHPDVQPGQEKRICRRRGHHPFPQPAGGWRIQVQPARRRAGGHGDNPDHRSSGQMPSWPRGLGKIRQDAL